MSALPLRVLRSMDEASALLEPTRLRLVKELVEPDSAAGLSRKLGLPRQRINYHLRELEKAGLVELVEERKKGNCTERVVRAVARAYVMSPEILGESVALAPDRFSSAYLVASAARVIRDVGELRARAERAGQKLATLALEVEVRFKSADDRAAFAEDLLHEMVRLAALYQDDAAPDGRAFRFMVGGYPKITKPESVKAKS